MLFGLFKPTWMSENTAKALKAVEKINDETELIQVAKRARHWKVKVKAIEKLNNQDVLVSIAKEKFFPDICRAAVSRLTNDHAIGEIAKNAVSSEARIAAIQKLNDQSILAEIAKDNKISSHIRKEAAIKLNDPAILARVIKNSSCDIADMTVVERLVDDVALGKIAKNRNQTDSVRSAAIWKLNDQALLEEFAQEEANWEIRLTATKRLTSCQKLAEIAQSDPYSYQEQISYSYDQYGDSSDYRRRWPVREVARDRLKILKRLAQGSASNNQP